MKKVFSIFLSLLLLLSSMGFTVSTHFCGDHASERVIGIEKRDVNCGMEIATLDCDLRTIETEIQATPCCSNEYDSYVLEDEYQAATSNYEMEKSIFVAWVVSGLIAFEPVEEPGSTIVPYSSPPLIQDIPVLNQSFLL